MEGGIQILKQRRVKRGTQIVTISVPTSAVNKLVNTRLIIGYVNGRVRQRIEVKKCY